jgi:hypothetical protein
MNNEPVAWMEIEEGGITEYKVWREPVSSKSIPLYTHPAKTLTDDPLVNFKPVWQEKPELTLTDEEIADLIANKVTDSEMIKQALRKAQEK